MALNEIEQAIFDKSRANFEAHVDTSIDEKKKPFIKLFMANEDIESDDLTLEYLDVAINENFEQGYLRGEEDLRRAQDFMELVKATQNPDEIVKMIPVENIRRAQCVEISLIFPNVHRDA